MTPPGTFDVYEQQLDWVPVSELYGFDAAVPSAIGNLGKYLGRPDHPEGPWFYLIKHPPYVRVPRHAHSHAVCHFLLTGSWLVGDDEGELRLPGFFHHEEAGAFWGPMRSGPEGSTFIAVYDGRPDFLLAHGREPGYTDSHADTHVPPDRED
ncbi:hypothetical protein H7I41_06535 [Mycobacterium manitobense]|uniref:Cupin domain-containing protein n=1 Tax=[Mycobacterium] manitobense TaxID=190147 RepID=A0A9X3BUK6_9MYCO|nr:hypothetical protein [[Mycobacterium] manitobense]MCV7169576.1 hypothetical protein [[Mycobacterium] manitobense]